VEPLEGRLCPSGGHLIVGSFANNGVLRYREDTRAFIDRFDRHNLGDLKNPVGGVFGPDGNLYVSSGLFSGSPPAVLQYDGTTGEFLRVFASQRLTSPRGILFGPDGNLYVANGNDDASGDPASVERFDGKTGAFLDYFVDSSRNAGLTHPSYMVFGPDGRADGKFDLYVAAAAEREGSSPHVGEILRYDGGTGDPLGVFVPPNSGGLNSPQGMLFGPDGSLYVASGNWWAGPEVFYKGAYPAGAVLHFQGPAGASPGAFLGTFVAGGSGGLANPAGMVFGPDASGDGRADLYVANSALKDGIVPIAGTSGVLRYDAATGAFLGTFVAPGSGLKFATLLTFTETDPTTLNYDGTRRESLTAVAAPAGVSVARSGIRSAELPSLAPSPITGADFGPGRGPVPAATSVVPIPTVWARPNMTPPSLRAAHGPRPHAATNPVTADAWNGRLSDPLANDLTAVRGD
jgi:hypothetical protein